MRKNLFYYLSFVLNAVLLFYIINQKKQPSNFRERSHHSPYCDKFDQHDRLQPGDLSANIESLKDYQDDVYEWDVCQSKKKTLPITALAENKSAIVPFYEPVKYCSFSPQIEQRFQFGFYGGSKVIKWPDFFECALLPPLNYRWPNKHIQFPTPTGESAISWSNLGLKAYDDVIAFNQRFPQNVRHFNTPYYDLHHEASATLAAKYIPFGKKVRTMLDIGGGAASLGFALTKRYDVLVLNTVRPEFPYCEFITERGGFCMLLDSFRPLPFVKFSFDVLHHAWIYHGSVPSEWRTVLLEQNRLIRPGGYLWIQDGFSRAVLQTIRYLLIEQLGYRVLYEEERPQSSPPKVFFGSIPYEVEWTGIMVKPNHIKGNELSC